MLDGATGPWGAHGYAYDAVGNRSAFSLTPPGGTASTDTYTYELTSNGLDGIDNPATGSRSYSYDGAGNTVAEARTLAGTEAWGYTYNSFGRLTSASLNGGLQGEYLYNALGQQVSRDVGGVVTLSIHDLAGNRIAEHDGTGVVIREYIWLDGRPLAVVEGGQTYQLHWDHILRPVMATSATGAVVWAASYLPFGGIDQVYVDTGALDQNLRFPGQWFQAETGLHQNWMRDYDPTTGRYLQADPLGLVDGPSVYGYARQSPVRYTDPRGEFVPLIILGINIYRAYQVIRVVQPLVALAVAANVAANSGPAIPKPEDKVDNRDCPPRCTKQTSPIWKSFARFRAEIKTNGMSGKKRRYYTWDYLHDCEIEVFDGRGKHLMAIDGLTGNPIKPMDPTKRLDL